MRPRIIIAGLWEPAGREELTLGTLKALEEAECLVLRTGEHALAPG